jgi:hypothetical protein
MFPRRTGVREATLLLLKEKCGRYTQLRVSSHVNFRDYDKIIMIIIKIMLLSV